MIARLIAFVFLPVLCSAAFAQDNRVLSGEVSYRERVALSPDAVLMIEVTAIDRSMIAQERIPTGGRQVPIPFEIEVPGDAEGTLRAGLSTGGRVDWLGEPVEIDAGMSGDIGELVLNRFQPMGFVSAFRCGDRMISVGFAGDNAILDTGSERLILAPSRAASGARYEAESDPDTWFWNQGDSALVSLGGEELPECHMSVPMDDTPYRAGGNEPFWSMTIEAGQMTLVRLGMDDLTMPVTETSLTDAGDILVIATDTERALRAVILRKPTLCRDSMTGMPHPETVELSMGDNTIMGCGGDPWSLLVGRTWVVEDIGGAGVVDTARTTMGFDDAGRVYGSGSCNRYNGPATLTGETLSFGALASTSMACPDALMTQERRFFDALAEVSRFDIDATGALILHGPGGPLVTARAATDGSAP
jgi:heat shock protein HslJ